MPQAAAITILAETVSLTFSGTFGPASPAPGPTKVAVPASSEVERLYLLPCLWCLYLPGTQI